MNDLRKCVLKTFMNGNSNYYNLVTKHNISKKEMVEFQLSICDELIEDGFFEDFHEIKLSILFQLSYKYKKMDKFYEYLQKSEVDYNDHDKWDKNMVESLLLNMNKTNHSFVDIKKNMNI